MSLRLYNTLTRQKEPFQPIDSQNVRMYVCGPTVYDFAHIGNARPVIVFDVLFRLLREIYGADHVTYVRNITDVDDKINARAAERYPDLAPEVGIRRLTEDTAAQFHRDIAALGVLEPTVEPRATEHISEMVALCDRLVAKGNAYVAADHVLFDVSSMVDYGKLSNRSLEEMEAGARVEVAPYKKGPMDFVLWKPSKPGEPGWPSPAGIAVPGRPGWHIECSAMSWKHLGEVFDIHGGGIDLAFPHHENEIAQSRCAHGTDVMARVWMHNGFLQVEGEKMSKSLGNFITIHELLATKRFGGQLWSGEVLKFAMLESQYRQPIDWSVKRLRDRERELSEWATHLMLHGIGELFEIQSAAGPSSDLMTALSDDLNTPEVIAGLRRCYSLAKAGSREHSLQLLIDCHFLGLLNPLRLGVHATGVSTQGGLAVDFSDTHDIRAMVANRLDDLLAAKLQSLRDSGIEGRVDDDGYVHFLAVSGEAVAKEDAIKGMIAARLEARKVKDFKESDRIRDELAAMGVTLKDTKNKETGEIETTWEIAR